METIPLNQETVALAKDILMSGFKGKYPPFDKCFSKSEKVTAKDILFEQYVQKTGCAIPKVFCYIVMNDVLGLVDGKDSDGNLGYHLTLNL